MYITMPRQVAALIVDRRDQLGLTQTDLSRTTGVSRAWISRLESGTHDLRLSTLLAILDALDMTLTVAPASVTDAADRSSLPAANALDDIIRKATARGGADLDDVSFQQILTARRT